MLIAAGALMKMACSRWRCLSASSRAAWAAEYSRPLSTATVARRANSCASRKSSSPKRRPEPAMARGMTPKGGPAFPSGRAQQLVDLQRAGQPLAHQGQDGQPLLRDLQLEPRPALALQQHRALLLGVLVVGDVGGQDDVAVGFAGGVALRHHHDAHDAALA